MLCSTSVHCIVHTFSRSAKSIFIALRPEPIRFPPMLWFLFPFKVSFVAAFEVTTTAMHLCSRHLPETSSATTKEKTWPVGRESTISWGIWAVLTLPNRRGDKGALWDSHSPSRRVAATVQRKIVTRGESYARSLSFHNANRLILRPTENAEVIFASKRPQKMRKFIRGS